MTTGEVVVEIAKLLIPALVTIALGWFALQRFRVEVEAAKVQLAATHKAATDTQEEVKVIKLGVDGMKDQLIRATEEKSFAAGVDKGAATIAANLQTVAPEVKVILNPDPKPGGQRRTDPPKVGSGGEEGENRPVAPDQ